MPTASLNRGIDVEFSGSTAFELLVRADFALDGFRVGRQRAQIATQAADRDVQLFLPGAQPVELLAVFAQLVPDLNENGLE